MMSTIAENLARMKVSLPKPAAPAAAYLPFVQSGKQLFVSGQLPFVEGRLSAVGLVGRDVELEAAKAAARHCAINILAQVQAAAGDLEKIARVVKLSVFVASAPGFAEQHLVANGASEFIAEAVGERGKHARAAVGVASLPLNAAVEVEAVIELA
ncbi:MAG: RidA family protein [Rhizobiaceae bacterium]|nr:RidA family protein [Rhizobiaceae bacterium]